MLLDGAPRRGRQLGYARLWNNSQRNSRVHSNTFLSFLGPFIKEFGTQMSKRAGKKKRKEKVGGWRDDSVGEVLTYKHESMSSIPKLIRKIVGHNGAYF